MAILAFRVVVTTIPVPEHWQLGTWE